MMNLKIKLCMSSFTKSIYIEKNMKYFLKSYVN